MYFPLLLLLTYPKVPLLPQPERVAEFPVPILVLGLALVSASAMAVQNVP